MDDHEVVPVPIPFPDPIPVAAGPGAALVGGAGTPLSGPLTSYLHAAGAGRLAAPQTPGIGAGLAAAGLPAGGLRRAGGSFLSRRRAGLSSAFGSGAFPATGISHGALSGNLGAGAFRAAGIPHVSANPFALAGLPGAPGAGSFHASPAGLNMWTCSRSHIVGSGGNICCNPYQEQIMTEHLRIAAKKGLSKAAEDCRVRAQKDHGGKWDCVFSRSDVDVNNWKLSDKYCKVRGNGLYAVSLKLSN